MPVGPDFLEDATTRRGPWGGPNLSAGVLLGIVLSCSSGRGGTSWISPASSSSRIGGGWSVGGEMTVKKSSSKDSLKRESFTLWWGWLSQGQALPVRVTKVLPDHPTFHADLREVVCHFMPYLDHHIALLPGIDIGCWFCHPVPQVPPLISGDSELKSTVWNEDTEAVPCEVLEKFWGNPPPTQCIFQPSKGSISRSRPGDESHAIFADGGYQVITLLKAGVLGEPSPPCE